MMKFSKNILLIMVLILSSLSFATDTSASSSVTTINKNYNWVFEYGNVLDEKTINTNTVKVLNKNNTKENGIKVSIGKNKKSIKVEAPKNGYSVGANYTLKISGVKIKKSKKAIEGITEKFVIHTPVTVKEAVATKSATKPVINKPIIDNTKYTVNIETSNIVFPKTWTNITQDTATPLYGTHAVNLTKLANAEINKYPKHLINKNLKNMYIVSSLTFDGAEYGGTYSDDSIYIVSQSDTAWTNSYSAELLHAEFSSILLNNYSKNFDEKAWKSVNPKDFKYSGDGYDYLIAEQNGTNTLPTTGYLENGFFDKYSMTNVENDFNIIASKLFTGNQTFWNSVDNNGKLNQKMKIAVKFYNSIDSSFTEEYFRSIKAN